MGTKYLLEMQNITKLFPGVKALDNVTFDVEEGEIHGLVGENGAGKSTLMNVLSGIYPYGSYTGNILYEGNECKFSNIRDSEKKGIVIIHQELATVPYMSIAENMFLGNEQGNIFGIDWDATHNKANEFLKVVGLKDSSHTLVKDISVGKQQLVEIAKALAKNVKLLILDEPTASLNEEDSQKILSLLLSLKQRGVTSILISHKLTEVSQVADHITIIRDGATIETLTKGSSEINEARVIKGMVGREMTDRYPKRESNVGDVVFEVKDWNVFHPLHQGFKVCDNINLNVRAGEVVGISGLMGAGRSEFAMSVFGKSYGLDITGKVFLHGKEINTSTVKKAIRNKIAYVTEDRKDAGLILSDLIRVNISLANLESISPMGRIDSNKEVLVAEEYRQKLRIKTPTCEDNVENLSGGNQQKVLLAKWMFAEPDVMIMDEPTRGIDVGAKYEIYTIINDLVAQNKSVIFISSEMPELLGMCDRIYVMNEGRIVGELSKEEATQEIIMAKILQSNKGE